MRSFNVCPGQRVGSDLVAALVRLVSTDFRRITWERWLKFLEKKGYPLRRVDAVFFRCISPPSRLRRYFRPSEKSPAFSSRGYAPVVTYCDSNFGVPAGVFLAGAKNKVEELAFCVWHNENRFQGSWDVVTDTPKIPGL